MKVVFAGTPEFSVPSLQALHAAKAVELQAVYTQPDRPAGRGKNLTASAVKRCAIEHGITVLQPDSLTIEEHIKQLRALAPDLMVVVAYGLLLPPSVLAIPRLGCINIHASLLPRWRGAAPIQRAIQAADPITGVCLMQMEAGLDSGPIIAHKKTNIDPQETAASLHDKLAALGAMLLNENLENLRDQSFVAEKQNPTQVTYAQRLSKTESAIDWQQPADLLERNIRAFNPWPMASFNFADSVIRIHQASLATNMTTNAATGEVVAIDKHGIYVQTGVGQLLLKVLQRSGGKPMSTKDFLNGFNIKVGTQLT